jgi:hypothetical protein
VDYQTPIPENDTVDEEVNLRGVLLGFLAEFLGPVLVVVLILLGYAAYEYFSS